MKTVVPDYYAGFRCIAGACKHSCCAGWEVDIDEDSLARYQTIPEIKRHISEEDVPHFVLQEDRCPFLRSDNLCRMILDYGEDMLCQICTDHPRFRNFWTDRVETGLGLACEAAAGIILSQKEPLALFEVDELQGTKKQQREDDYAGLPEDEVWLMNVRKDLLRMSHEERVSLWNLLRANHEQFESLPDEICSAFTSNLPQALQEPADRFWEYLVYRHIADALYYDDFDERTAFIVWSYQTVLIAWLQSDGSFETVAEIARDFSNRYEYNTEKMESFGCGK